MAPNYLNRALEAYGAPECPSSVLITGFLTVVYVIVMGLPPACQLVPLTQGMFHLPDVRKRLFNRLCQSGLHLLFACGTNSMLLHEAPRVLCTACEHSYVSRTVRSLALRFSVFLAPTVLSSHMVTSRKYAPSPPFDNI